MSLKQTIQTDFTTAFKAKEEVKKSTLSMLKAEITKAEKLNGKDLDDQAITKVILSCVKQRKQSIEEFTKGGRIDLADKEAVELIVLEAYLPKQMSTEEVGSIIEDIAAEFSTETNPNKKVGMIMGAFNKKYSGQFDNKALKAIVEAVV